MITLLSNFENLKPLFSLRVSSPELAFMPHGMCYLWQPGLVGLHVVSDALIALAYYSIPVMLVYFVRKRRDVPFHWMFLLFGAFIVACGTTHILEVWTLWHPNYWLSGGIKAITAIVSLYTASELIPILPLAVALPSPEQLEETNRELKRLLLERDATEDALRASEERFRLLIEGVKDYAIFLLDRDGKVSSWNAGSQAIKGYQASEIIGQHFSCFYLKEDIEQGKPQQELKEAADSGRYEDESWRLRKDGSRFWANVIVTALREPNGQLQGFAIVTRDITERQLAKLALEEQAATLSKQAQLLELAHDTIMVRDVNNMITFWNHGAEEMYGFSKAEALGESSHTLLQIQLPQPLEDIEAKLLRAGRWEGELVHVRRDGTPIVIASRWALQRDELGLPTAILEINNDITERKQAELALRELNSKLEQRVAQRTAALLRSNEELEKEIAERRYLEEELRSSLERYRFLEERQRLVIEAASIGTWFWDITNDNVIMTPLCCQMLGLLPDTQIPYQGFLDLVHPDDQKIIQRAVIHTIQDQMDYRVEYRIIASDGSVRWLSSTGCASCNSLGEIERMMGATIDITAQKQSEAQIKASLEEKEVLLKEIHHRVKNNLQIISSLLSLESESICDRHALEVFIDCQNRIESMALIHEQLYQSEDLTTIDFSAYTDTLVTNLVSSSEACSSNINLKIDINDIFLGIDTAVPCGLIINELVLNSLKHAFPEGRSGEICINVQQQSYNTLKLTIKDDGIGFPEDLDFENTESLGLQLVNILTNQIEGSITLKREGGTEFKIEFPLVNQKN
jgi:PAS domain S-box-containing protein